MTDKRRTDMTTSSGTEDALIFSQQELSDTSQRCKFAPDDFVAVIDQRTLTRECLAQALNAHPNALIARTFTSLQHWKTIGKPQQGTLRAVLLNVTNGSSEDIDAEVRAAVAEFEPVAVVVLSQDQDLRAILHIIGMGVCGYIPTSVDIGVCIQALYLAIAGGRFVPASSLLSMREFLELSSVRNIAGDGSFTARQTAVAEALRCGKANKLIARELQLCESTVKVHIRNIMKKLGATNRTEVAFKIGGNACFSQAYA
ncbi:response regulator transcription factor [Rhizobium sp. Leaf386]|uniref:helix-turn-helix transcriptional regulator n=1 Tax=Rhizobium sp. Leaf386 TaxID=1736359 RepID=UPI000AE605F0|nr:response regulator transcription factor [Rhizobium sp. Leaf386]